MATVLERLQMGAEGAPEAKENNGCKKGTEPPGAPPPSWPSCARLHSGSLVSPALLDKAELVARVRQWWLCRCRGPGPPSLDPLSLRKHHDPGFWHAAPKHASLGF